MQFGTKILLLSLTVFFLFSLQAFGGNSPAQNDDNVLTDEELALYNQLLLANNYLLEPNDKKRWKMWMKIYGNPGCQVSTKGKQN